MPGSPFLVRWGSKASLTPGEAEASPGSRPSAQWSPKDHPTGGLRPPSSLSVGEGPGWGVPEGRGQHFDSWEGSQLSISCSALSMSGGGGVE